jgi:hypothetical protein
MRQLNAEGLDRLVRSNRRLMLGLTVTVCLLILLVVVLVIADLDFAIPGGAGLGVLIGMLLVIPNRRVVRDLGLTVDEARAILQAEKERRSGVAAMSPAARADREALRGLILLVVGLVLMAVMVVSAWYFVGKAGQTADENAGVDPWFAASFIGLALGFVLGIPALISAKNHRRSAAEWREAAAREPVE